MNFMVDAILKKPAWLKIVMISNDDVASGVCIGPRDVAIKRS